MANYEFRKGFIELRRTTGKMAWVRVDEITALLEGEEKRDGKPISIVTIQIRNNVSIHVEIEFLALKGMIQEAAGTQVHIIPWKDPVQAFEAVDAGGEAPPVMATKAAENGQ